MPKTIMLDDDTYAKLKKKAKSEDRSISKMAKILINKGLEKAPTEATASVSPYPPVDWSKMI